jgi:hypothetical protein
MSSRTLATIASVGALLLLPSSALGQVPTQDSVIADATTSPGSFFSNIRIDVRSGPSGEAPTGTATFFVAPFGGGGFMVGGPVTCLTVNGNTATMVVTDPTFRLLKIQVVDGAATGTPDTFSAAPDGQPDPLAPNDCSPLPPTAPVVPMTSGDIVVVDAPPLPTTKDQCKNNGWRNYGSTFKNEGQCVAFVQRPTKPST